MSDVHLIISGGGVHHSILLQDISKYTRITDVKISDELEIKSDMKEALLMAVLGVARKQEMTANMPGVTGAEKLVVLGDLII
jgi:anhydro-N-acetylmuramic acid kinase